MKVFHIVFCISVAFGSLGLPEDEMDALNAAFLEDDLCEGDCSLAAASLQELQAKPLYHNQGLKAPSRKRRSALNGKSALDLVVG